MFPIYNITRIILFPFFFLLLILSCKESPTTPDEQIKPPGYQEDIPWPSLADSPWPMYRRDPQNTGRSKYMVMNNSFSIVNEVDASNLLSGCALGLNSFYFNNSLPSSLFSFNQISLSKNWEKGIGMESLTTPLITSECIFTSAENLLLAFNQNGDSLWSFRVNSDYIYQRSFNIDKDGNIYVISNRTLTKLDQQGNVINQLSNDNINSFNTSAFSPDGSTLYLQGNNVSVIAVDVNSFNIKWTYGNAKTTIPPVVDSYGNIYLLPWTVSESYYLYSVNPEGILNWKFKHNERVDAATVGTPAIGKYGDIYFGLDTLYSVSFNGKLNWKIDIDIKYNNVGVNSDISSITVDPIDNILVGTYDNRVIMLSKNGSLVHEIKLTDIGRGLLPIIISNSQIYASMYKGESIFILK